MSGAQGANESRRLRPDTTLSPADRPTEERYVRELPVCCLRSFKAVVLEDLDRRRLSFECGCGKSWRVTSSLDDRVLERFVVHGGPRVVGPGDPGSPTKSYTRGPTNHESPGETPPAA